jgi:lipopolysaccharide transport system ATP-binding protein
MSDIAIKCEGLSKRYKIGERESYKSLRDSLANAFGAPARRLRAALRGSNGKNGQEEAAFWALKDVSFEVEEGEVVGIIGRNGAGKSTLLKILSRVTEPTGGYADIYGRVGSLLEVGTGFHPELTGRENIFLNGAILGMSRSEIKSKFDEIVAFAEVEKFIDTPVKRYSSGMYVRLAFGVAAYLEPEVLIVDEVLAVGDAQFQKKCLGKMGNVAKEGRTVLFVSHNMAAVKSLCKRVIQLDAGMVVSVGEAAEVISNYLEGGTDAWEEKVWLDLQKAPGNEKVRINAVRIINSQGITTSQFELQQPVTVEVEYQVLIPDTILNVSISLFNQEDTYILASPSTTDTEWYQRPHPAGCFRSRCLIPGGFLNTGRFGVTVILVENGCNIIAQLDKVVHMDMVDLGVNRGGYWGYWGGVIRPLLNWTTEYSESR